MSTPVKCVDMLPTNPGHYNVAIAGVHTFLPIFLKFDGVDWDWDEIDFTLTSWSKTINDVYWYPPQ